MSDIEYSTILIELDALLDTRLALLASLGDTYLDHALSNDYYHNRISDKFGDLSIERFYELYGKRDKSILKEAFITPMGVLLKEFAFSTLKQILNTPYHYQPKILLNIYPYDLNEDEIEIIIRALINVTLNKADIQVINTPYEDITPSYVKKHISSMILYNCYKWIETHSENGKFKKTICPEVCLLGPAIYFKSYHSNNPNEALKSFEAMQTLMEPLINLRLIPVENFSIVLKRAI